MEITEIVDEEERIAALEKRVRYLDAMVRGLAAEFQDIRAVTGAITRREGERSRKELRPELGKPDSPPASAEILPESPSGAGIRKVSTVSLPGEDAAKDTPGLEMAQIMQPDGTMKPEPRYGDRNTVDPASMNSRTPRTGFRKKQLP